MTESLLRRALPVQRRHGRWEPMRVDLDKTVSGNNPENSSKKLVWLGKWMLISLFIKISYSFELAT